MKTNFDIRLNRRDFLFYSLGIATGIPLTIAGLVGLGFVARKVSSFANFPSGHSSIDFYVDSQRILDNPEYGPESLEALSSSLDSKQMDPKESRINIEKNLVSIVEYDREEHESTVSYWPVGTGFLITENGFVLTAYHCIEDFEKTGQRINKEKPCPGDTRKTLGIVDQEGYGYAVDTSFWAADRDLEIALIKAKTKAEPKPVKFMTSPRDLVQDQKVRLFGMTDNRTYNQLGKVLYTNLNQMLQPGNHKVYNTFLTDAHSEPGFSGGVFTTSKGEFAGIFLYSTHNKYDEIGLTGGAHTQGIKNLVNKTVNMLQRISE